MCVCVMCDCRWQRAGFTALMVGRGALIKPWIFQEIREVGSLNPGRLLQRAAHRY